MKASLLIACVIVYALFSCGSSDDDPGPVQSMSFKMNGTEYKFDKTQFQGGSPDAGYMWIKSAPDPIKNRTGVATDFPYWFDIQKSSAGTICALLIPKEFPIPFIDSLGDCNFQIPTIDMNGNPLDEQKVYHYESGTISFSKINCATRSYYDLYCLCTRSSPMCDLAGTFNLTFRNGLNETITLTDGNFFVPDVYQ